MSDGELQDSWHRATCKELEGRVKGRRFLVTLQAEAGQGETGKATTPEQLDPDAWETLAKNTEEWLEGLNPSSIDADDPPRHELRVADVRIELSAVPKKQKQGTSGSLIANPFPGIIAFEGSHSAGPADPFDADAD
jgi:hypothetical protein